MRSLLEKIATLLGPRTLSHVWRKSQEDDVPGLTAEVAYYVLFAIFPFLLLVASLIALLIPEPDQALVNVLILVHRFVPAETTEMLATFMATTLRSNRPDLLSLGIVGTLWAGSQGFTAVIKALNRVYGVRESRNWLQHRAVSLAMVIGAALVAITLVIVMIGADPGGILSRWLALPPQLVLLWGWLRWPVAFVVLTVVLALLYCQGPCRRSRWHLVTPGGLLATIAWIVVSAGLTAYIDVFGWYNATYGAIGGVIILLTWIYLGVFLMLLGAEANVVLEREGVEQALNPGRPRAASRAHRSRVGSRAVRPRAGSHS